MKKCAQCHGKLGLGIRCRNLWNGRWWAHTRFCSARCEGNYELERYNANAKQHRWYTAELVFARDAAKRFQITSARSSGFFVAGFTQRAKLSGFTFRTASASQATILRAHTECEAPRCRVGAHQSSHFL
jgi:hypothetical protein